MSRYSDEELDRTHYYTDEEFEAYESSREGRADKARSYAATKTGAVVVSAIVAVLVFFLSRWLMGLIAAPIRSGVDEHLFGAAYEFWRGFLNLLAWLLAAAVAFKAYQAVYEALTASGLPDEGNEAEEKKNRKNLAKSHGKSALRWLIVLLVVLIIPTNGFHVGGHGSDGSRKADKNASNPPADQVQSGEPVDFDQLVTLVARAEEAAIKADRNADQAEEAAERASLNYERAKAAQDAEAAEKARLEAEEAERRAQEARAAAHQAEAARRQVADQAAIASNPDAEKQQELRQYQSGNRDSNRVPDYDCEEPLVPDGEGGCEQRTDAGGM